MSNNNLPLGEAESVVFVGARATDVNSPPNVSYTESGTLETGAEITFDASATVDDFDGSPDLVYDWDFGDGNTLSDGGDVVTHTYTAEGDYTVALTVTDTYEESNSTSTTYTITVPVVDDFEDGDLTVNWSGDINASYWSATTTRPHSGTYAAERAGGDANWRWITYTGDSAPEAGDTFETFVYFDTNLQHLNVEFGRQDSQNYYRFDFNGYYYEVNVYKRVNGSGTTSTTSITESNLVNKWIKVVVNWGEDGTITVDYIDTTDDSTIASMTLNDTNFTSGDLRIGSYSGYGSTPLFVDDITKP